MTSTPTFFKKLAFNNFFIISGAGVGVLHGLLYAVGGHDGPLVRKSVECYIPDQDEWRCVRYGFIIIDVSGSGILFIRLDNSVRLKLLTKVLKIQLFKNKVTTTKAHFYKNNLKTAANQKICMIQP